MIEYCVLWGAQQVFLTTGNLVVDDQANGRCIVV